MVTFLSKGVSVPEEHLCRGLAAGTVGPDGVVFDWTAVTQGLFHVCVQKKRPKECGRRDRVSGLLVSSSRPATSGRSRPSD